MFDIWNREEPLASEQYRKPNYCTREHGVKDGWCVIYCSSNDIWYPNEEDAFRRSFVEGDYYEWKNVGCDRAAKEIFVRDIYKSWYVTGISETIDSIDRLADFLRTEAGERPVVCVGSSSGGYLAAALGVLLDADHVVAFSAQWELFNDETMGKNPFLRKYRDDPQRAKYYDLKPLLSGSEVPVFYIVPIRSEEDLHQCDHIKSAPCVRPILFRSRFHGVVVPKGNLRKLISMPTAEWMKLYERCKGRQLSPVLFSVKNEGVMATARDILKAVFKKIKQKLAG